MKTKAFVLAALVGAAALSANAGVHFGFSFQAPLPVVVPPLVIGAPAPVAVIPPFPGVGYVWDPGCWSYYGGVRVWVPGAWHYRPGYVGWRPGYGGYYRYDRDFDHHDFDRDFGHHDRDFGHSRDFGHGHFDGGHHDRDRDRR